ncbi:curli-like amyloid fiber formation chaperone CsgH [Sphingosinicella sp. CPCC 101087]|uniref:curli-like amyloid fiber formation chaperone CsgH n=1 Tax=Sphingosinicella sp. CPCC 101087 TaxID=2497754 RepID=UPI00101C62FB|nr:curli-like amyloid fiber formation chaperone CsgH [Sphingosinicella sp. CPCC 101087]
MQVEIWALALSLMGATTPPPQPAPVRLLVEERGQGVELKVVGESDEPVQAGYALEVTSDAAAGGNRSVQRGQARLVPGVTATLMTLRLGNVSDGGWSARLRVEPVGGAAYEEVLQSGPDR